MRIIALLADRVVVGKADPTVFILARGTLHMIAAADLLAWDFTFRASFGLLLDTLLGSFIILLYSL